MGKSKGKYSWIRGKGRGKSEGNIHELEGREGERVRENIHELEGRGGKSEGKKIRGSRRQQINQQQQKNDISKLSNILY